MTTEPTLVGAYTAIRAASGTSISIPKPAGLAVGDTLVAYITDQSGTLATEYTSAQGFVRKTPAMGGAQASLRVHLGLVHTITDTGAEPSDNYTFTNANAGGRCVLTLKHWRGVHLTDPVAATTASYGGNGTTGGSRIIPITVPEDNCVFDLAVGANLSAPNPNAPSSQPTGFTQDVLVSTSTDTGTSRTVMWSGHKTVGTGPTANADTLWSPAPGAVGASVLILRPAPDPVLPPTPYQAELWNGTSLEPVTVTIGPTEIGVKDVLALRTQTYTVPEMMVDLQTPGKVFWAHRGGSAEWSEMTMRAYTNAIWHGCKVLEVSVWRSSDGVFIMSHDQTLERVTASTHNIPSTPAATMLGLAVDAPVTGGVIGRLEDVLNAYGRTHVLVIDDKPSSFKTEITALVEAFYGSAAEAKKHVVWKMYGNDLSRAVSWEAAGYRTWAYFYDDEVLSINPTQAAQLSMLGLNWEATQANWNAILAFGKPIVSHLILNAGQAATAVSKGASGLQCPKVVGVVPQVNVLP